MWLLINVDELDDVNKNENRRFLLHDDIVIEHVDYIDNSTVHVIANGYGVHPATPDSKSPPHH